MKNDFAELVNVLGSIEKSHSAEPFSGVIAGAYTLWICATKKAVDVENLSAFLEEHEKDEAIRMFILSRLESHWDDYRRYITTFPAKELENFILDYKVENMRGVIETVPEKVHELIVALLDIQSNDYVADMGAGVGDFLRTVNRACPEARLWGNDIATTATAIASIRAKFFNGKLTIVQEDMFISKQEDAIFDKIHCFPPWGLRLGTMPSARAFLATQPPSLPVLKGTGACEWIFALRVLASMKRDGKATLFMTNGGTFNLLDTPIRKYFVERGMIAAVIAMPGRLLEYTAVPSSIIVFCNGNTQVQMVDATQLGTKGRRGIELTDKDIERIVNAVNGNDDEISKSVTNDEILENDSVLNPGRYVRDSVKLKNAVTFGSVIKSIVRGASLSAAELDKLSSEKPTGYQYLMLSNIKNGIIDEDLPYLNEFDPRWQRFCLQPNDLIISKIGYPFKVAVASESKQTIIANGNLFIIRLDEAVADPYYVKAFLESEAGITILKNVAVGAAMPNLSAEAIKNMEIDLPAIEKQRVIATRYKAKLNEIVLLKRKLEQAVNSLGQMLFNAEE